MHKAIVLRVILTDVSIIKKDTLGLAFMDQVIHHLLQTHAVNEKPPNFDEKIPEWYHVPCFFAKQRVKTVGDIFKFESLRLKNQEMVKSKVAGGPSLSNSEIGNGTSSNGISKKATKRKINDNLVNFTIEYSKYSLATCRDPEEKIVDQTRISKKKYDDDEARRHASIDLRYHLEFFPEVLQKLELCNFDTKLPSFKHLEKNDQERFKKALPQMQSVKVKKKESDDFDATELPKKSRKQNETKFYYRDDLKEIKNKHQHTLWTYYNNQQITLSKDCLLRHTYLTSGGSPKITLTRESLKKFRCAQGLRDLDNSSHLPQARQKYSSHKSIKKKGHFRFSKRI